MNALLKGWRVQCWLQKYLYQHNILHIFIWNSIMFVRVILTHYRPGHQLYRWLYCKVDFSSESEATVNLQCNSHAPTATGKKLKISVHMLQEDFSSYNYRVLHQRKYACRNNILNVQYVHLTQLVDCSTHIRWAQN